MKKVLIVATVVKLHIMHFHLPILKMFKENGWETAVAACNDYDDPSECCIPYCDTYYNIPFERSPLNQNNLRAYRELKKVIDAGHYDIIHCNTPVGGVTTRLAARRHRPATRVFYTAHGFHFYRGAPVKNWLLYYPIEWLCAHWTDVLLTMNREDYALAQRRMHAGQVVYVPGVGIDLENFNGDRAARAEKRRELGLPENAVVLLSVGELNENKNHATVIRAITGMDVHYLIAGQGPERDALQALIDGCGLSDRVQLLGYRRDMRELYAAADAFVFPSFREGLSVSIMEAMASALPCAVSRIRGNVDLVDEGQGGVWFDPHSVEDCRRAIGAVLASGGGYGEWNRRKIREFSIETVLEKMREVYEI